MFGIEMVKDNNKYSSLEEKINNSFLINSLNWIMCFNYRFMYMISAKSIIISLTDFVL